MTKIGYTMMCEQAGPKQLVRDVAPALTVRRFLPGTPLTDRIDAHTAFKLWRLFELPPVSRRLLIMV